jgi:VIT1/CCC1 family predicted Fe2+/Mn2+ transporter
MPTAPHVERHFHASASVRDIVIGMSDGLTVPFALAAGLAGVAEAGAHGLVGAGTVVIAGLAEIAAGSIAMGLGGYLAARTDREHYAAERKREYAEIEAMPEREADDVARILRSYGLSDREAATVVAGMRTDKDRWVEFMMRFELGLEEPDPRRARNSAVTIAASYLVGGLIPLAPYMLINNMTRSLWVSVAVTLAALLLFGGIKSKFTGINPIKGAVQTALIGGLAAAAAFTIARLVGHG